MPALRTARSGWAYALLWAATRALVVMMALGPLRISGLDVTSDVSVIYQGWYEVLRTGTFPLDDVTWQYPPAAGLVMLLPGALGAVLRVSYLHAFLVVVAAADATAARLLWRAGAPRGARGAREAAARAGAGPSRAGAWYWLASVPLLGPTVYARYDLVVTVVAVAGLLAMATRPRLGGALAGLGTMIKVWPVLTVIGLPRGRRVRDGLAVCALTVGAIALFFAATTHGAYAFLGFQKDRGVEVESLGGTVFQLARGFFGWSGTVSMNYGSLEFLGPGVSVVAKASVALTALAFCWLLLWRWRANRWSAATPLDAALVALMLFTVTSRVISPQYLVWLLGLAAVCVSVRGTRMRPVAWLLLPACVLTTLEFPVLFGDVVYGHPLGATLVVLRNLLLVAATVLAARRLWHSTVAVPTPPPALVPPTRRSAALRAGDGEHAAAD